jgi:hypothetical protein
MHGGFPPVDGVAEAGASGQQNAAVLAGTWKSQRRPAVETVIADGGSISLDAVQRPRHRFRAGITQRCASLLQGSGETTIAGQRREQPVEFQECNDIALCIAGGDWRRQ